MLALVSGVRAQGTDQLLTTVGTTVEKGGRTYAYLLWQPGAADATFGKRFAIHSKPGGIGAAGNFTRLGIQSLQTSPTTVRALLELGEKVDAAGEHAASRIDGLYREVTLRTGEAPADPADPNLDAAGKLVFLIESAVTDTRLLSRLFFLGRAHPGVMLSLGHAFCIEIPAAGEVTYELREVDGLDADVQVLGRVSLDPASPLVLDAPSSPMQVFHPVKVGSQYPINPKDNLNARFRWGVGSALRAKMPYSFGFDLFRVKRKTASILGWDAAPPTPQEMLDAVEAMDPDEPSPEFSRVNALPIMVGDLLTPAQAADPNDRERIDLADDGIWYEGADGKLVRRPYSDGESYYYFVAARGITGLPGLLSAGTLVVMCDRLPPNPPSIVSVLGEFTPPEDPADWADQGGSAALQVKFRQLADAPSDEKPTGYYIYRWSTSQQYLDNVGNPLVHRIGFVAHKTNTNFRTFSDDGSGAPTIASDADHAVWYTVRSVGRSACKGKVYSGHSAPVAGVLRDFEAPAGPTGTFVICRSLPWVDFKERTEDPPKGEGDLPQGFQGVSVDVLREGRGVVSALIEVARGKDGGGLLLYSKRHYFQNSDLLRVNLRIPEPFARSERLTIRVRAATATGLVSPVAETVSPTTEVPVPYARYIFEAGVTPDCNPIDVVLDNPPVHETRDPNGIVNVITGTIIPPLDQGVREWRVYRRVGADGPLSLIAKKEGSLPASSTWEDDTPPNANGERVCYYAQVFDQNANPSPLIPLGCVLMLNPDLPTPMLSPAKVLSESGGRARVKLEWFCDPVGVERFEVLIAQDGGGAPDVGGLSDLLGDSSIGGVSSDFPELSFYPFQTARVTQNFGPGPGFGLEIEIPADKVLYFALRACGPGAFPRTSGTASNVVRARWENPVSGPQPVIPWPARPLPGSFDARRTIGLYELGEGPFWPMVLPEDFLTPTAILVGLVHEQIETSGNGKLVLLAGDVPPEDRLFKVREGDDAAAAMEDLMPFMLYRYQEPSAAFPNARPNLIQCTPLLDRMSWRKELFGKDIGYRINDPYFLYLSLHGDIGIPLSGEWDDTHVPLVAPPGDLTGWPSYVGDANAMVLVRDPLPVIAGAKYRHLIVRFTKRGEIRHVIPIDPVQH